MSPCCRLRPGRSGSRFWRRWRSHGPSARRTAPARPADAPYRSASPRTRAAFPPAPSPGRAMAWQWYTHGYLAGLGRLVRELQPDILDVWEEPWSVVAAQAVYLRDRLSPRTRL